jgi:hypothetical protein
VQLTIDTTSPPHWCIWVDPPSGETTICGPKRYPSQRMLVVHDTGFVSIIGPDDPNHAGGRPVMWWDALKTGMAE